MNRKSSETRHFAGDRRDHECQGAPLHTRLQNDPPREGPQLDEPCDQDDGKDRRGGQIEVEVNAVDTASPTDGDENGLETPEDQQDDRDETVRCRPLTRCGALGLIQNVAAAVLQSTAVALDLGPKRLPLCGVRF